MKKIFLAVFLLTATATLIGVSSETVYAKKGGNSNSIPASQVPAPVRMNFKSQFPTAKQVEWEFTPVYYGTPIYTASFTMNGQKWQANYYADGTFISAYPKS